VLAALALLLTERKRNAAIARQAGIRVGRYSGETPGEGRISHTTGRSHSCHKERFKRTVMVVDRATMSGRYLEHHADASEGLARARAINAEASDDVAFVVNVNIDGWGPVEPESIYRFLKQRGVI